MSIKCKVEGMSIESIEVGKTPRVFVRITSLGSAVACPSSSGTTVIFQPEAQSIRWRPDGIAPTAAVGFLVTAGTTVKYTGDLTKVKFIEVAGGGTLNVAVFE